MKKQKNLYKATGQANTTVLALRMCCFPKLIVEEIKKILTEISNLREGFLIFTF